jgi:cell shape-determining protein MreC
MMNSSRPNNRRLLAATVLVCFLFVVDVLLGGKIRNELRAGAAAASQWAEKPFAAIAGSGFFSSRAALESQNQSLTEEVAQLQERAAGSDALQAENGQLQAMAHLAQTAPGITAPVVSSVRSSPYGTFLIGAGSQDGIARGDLVLTEGGFVVGAVGDLGAHVALVAEVFAPGASIDAILDGASVSIEGSGGGNARTSLPRGVAIAAGDPVVAPGFRERPVGVVGNVASSSASASQDIHIRLPVNLASLQYVYIVSAQ